VRAPLALALLLLAACESRPPTLIDGSSAETFNKTTAAARRDLPDADRLDYDRALASVGTRRFGTGDPDALARTTFDGMTAEQVVKDYRDRQR
jgi:hypothetical protein